MKVKNIKTTLTALVIICSLVYIKVIHLSDNGLLTTAVDVIIAAVLLAYGTQILLLSLLLPFRIYRKIAGENNRSYAVKSQQEDLELASYEKDKVVSIQ